MGVLVTPGQWHFRTNEDEGGDEEEGMRKGSGGEEEEGTEDAQGGRVGCTLDSRPRRMRIDQAETVPPVRELRPRDSPRAEAASTWRRVWRSVDPDSPRRVGFVTERQTAIRSHGIRAMDALAPIVRMNRHGADQGKPRYDRPLDQVTWD